MNKAKCSTAKAAVEVAAVMAVRRRRDSRGGGRTREKGRKEEATVALAVEWTRPYVVAT